MSTTAIQLLDHSECVALTSSVAASAVGGLGTRRILKRQQNLWLSDSPFDRVYRLDEGRMSLIATDSKGREIPLRVIVPGDWFGEYCFCREQDAPHSEVVARAERDCRITEVSSGVWVRHLASSESSVREFLTFACRRIAQSERRVLMLARRRAEDRIALFLLEVATPGSERLATATPVHCTHAAIATATALSRAHVSVTLSEFRRRGLVQYRRGEPLFLNIRKLRAFIARGE